MLELKAKTRKITGKKVKSLRSAGIVPAVLYGPKIKNSLSLEVDLKEFEKVLKEAGESSLLSLKIEGEGKENLVLIHDLEKDFLTEKPIHIDFYQPDLAQEIEAKVPLIFEGESLAVKDLGGTLIKNISEVRVKAKPQSLPKEIKVNISKLLTFEDSVVIGDIQVPQGVKIVRDPKDIIAYAARPQKIEEELAKPVEEKVEEVEKVGEKEKKEAAEGEVTASKEERPSPAKAKEGNPKK